MSPMWRDNKRISDIAHRVKHALHSVHFKENGDSPDKYIESKQQVWLNLSPQELLQLFQAYSEVDISTVNPILLNEAVKLNQNAYIFFLLFFLKVFLSVCFVFHNNFFLFSRFVCFFKKDICTHGQTNQSLGNQKKKKVYE